MRPVCGPRLTTSGRIMRMARNAAHEFLLYGPSSFLFPSSVFCTSGRSFDFWSSRGTFMHAKLYQEWKARCGHAPIFDILRQRIISEHISTTGPSMLNEKCAQLFPGLCLMVIPHKVGHLANPPTKLSIPALRSGVVISNKICDWAN